MAAENYAVTVNGAGDKSGRNGGEMDWANAMGLAEWQTDVEDNNEPGDVYYVEEGTYTLTGNWDTARSGTGAAIISIIGVKAGTSNEPPIASDHADGANRPLIAAAANTFILEDYYLFRNIRVTTTEALGFAVNQYCIFSNCSSINSSETAHRVAYDTDNYCTFIACEGVSTAGRAFKTDGSSCLFACYAHDSDIGFLAGGNFAAVINSIFDTCTTAGIAFDTRTVGRMFNNIIYDCGIGIRITTGYSCIGFNNILDENTTGAAATTQYISNYFDYNCWDNDTDVSNVIKGNNKSDGDPGMADPANADFTVTQADANVHNLALDVGDKTGATV